MKMASVADLKARFSAYLKASEKWPVIVTRNGKPVAALVPVADEEEMERLAMAYSRKLQANPGGRSAAISFGCRHSP